MCGIAGIISGKNLFPNEAAAAALQRIASSRALRNRGPDNNDIKYLTRVDGRFAAGLVSTRLAVTDRHNDQANMPMMSQDGRFVITYNGQIYNFHELRKQLEDSYVFKTQSDTEVILAGYAVWGKKILDYLRGMFAFCIYDTVEKTAFMAVDIAAQKPLYYYLSDDNACVFSSEIETLFESGIVPCTIEKQDMQMLFALRYAPGKKTGFSNVYKMEPGTCFLLRSGKATVERYFYLSVDENGIQNRDDLSNRLSDVIKEAHDKVVTQSEQKPTLFLSSGIDSGYLAYLSREKPYDYFTMRYDPPSAPEHQQAVNYIKSNIFNGATIKVVDGGFSALSAAFDEWCEQAPDILFSKDMLGLYILYKSAAQSGVRVIVTGCGPDEILEGYSFGIRLENMTRHSTDVAQHYFDASCFIYGCDHNALFFGGLEYLRRDMASYVSEFINLHKPKSVMQAAQVANWYTRSAFECRKSDCISGHFGIESRKPYYERDVVNLCFAFPAEWKRPVPERKMPLRQSALLSGMPRDAVMRPKTVFSSPDLAIDTSKQKEKIIKKLKNESLLRDLGIIDVPYFLGSNPEPRLLEQAYFFEKTLQRLMTKAQGA